MSLLGNLRTLRPAFQDLVQNPQTLPSRHFRAFVKDDLLGDLRITGRLSESFDNDELVVLLHGVAGDHRSYYLKPMTKVASDNHVSVLRLNLRGADRAEKDFYHAGLVDDLKAALASPELTRFRKIYVVGYSLGGHIALRYAALGPDPRVRAIAAVTAPLNLQDVNRKIDSGESLFYRRMLLTYLRGTLFDVVKNGGRLPIDVDEMSRISTFRSWDDKIIAPRFGFSSAENYWEESSVAPLLTRIRIPALTLSAKHDPVVPIDSIHRSLADAWNIRSLTLEDAGHVTFKQGQGLSLKRGKHNVFGKRHQAEEDILEWLRQFG